MVMVRQHKILIYFIGYSKLQKKNYNHYKIVKSKRAIKITGLVQLKSAILLKMKSLKKKTHAHT